MIASVHLADVGPRAVPRLLRTHLEPRNLPGLRYAEMTIAAPMSGRLPPSPQPGRMGLIAAWEDDGALDHFLAQHPAARRLAGGWHVRLEPVRVSADGQSCPSSRRKKSPWTRMSRWPCSHLGG